MIKVKDKSLATLEHELDLIFGQFIALRDYNNGWKCFICGVRIPSKAYGQVCHFIPRGKMPTTRYHEKNSHFGCIDCNCYDQNHQGKYVLKMLEVYGLDTIEHLNLLSNTLQKFMRHEIQEMIEYYKIKVTELKKLKGI